MHNRLDSFEVCKAGLIVKKSTNIPHHVDKLKKTSLINAKEALDKIQH